MTFTCDARRETTVPRLEFPVITSTGNKSSRSVRFFEVCRRCVELLDGQKLKSVAPHRENHNVLGPLHRILLHMVRMPTLIELFSNYSHEAQRLN